MTATATVKQDGSHTRGPWVILGANCGGGLNLGIKFTDAKGVERDLVLARTIAVRSLATLCGRDPIEEDEAAANAHRLLTAFNEYEWLCPPGEGSLADTFGAPSTEATKAEGRTS